MMFDVCTNFPPLEFQPHRLGMAFKDSVANPEDMILVRRRRDAKPVSKEDYPDVQEALRKGGDDDGCVLRFLRLAMLAFRGVFFRDLFVFIRVVLFLCC